MKKPIFAGTGITIIILAIIVGSYYMTKKNIDLAYNTIKIAQLENNAFGSLQSDQTQAFTQDASIKETSGIGKDGGGGLISSEAAVNINLPSPEYIKYNYIYKGEDLEITESEMEVLKRIKDKTANQEFANYISKINLDSLVLGKFQNTEITNLQLNENRPFGYSLYLDFLNNNISISTNWNKWPSQNARCQNLIGEESSRCYEEEQLSPEDVPAESEIIAIASQFLSNYGVDMSMYGEPKIMEQWRIGYDLTEDGSKPYSPEIISVVYPLVINEQIIYDEAGNKSGINVQVNIRHKKASGLNGLTSQNYASSNYAVETDSQTIIELAEKGGLRRTFKYPEAIKTVELEIGTPTLGLIKYYQFNQNKNETTELLVPAYIFPILDALKEKTHTYTQNIVVPLIKEIIAERISGDDNGLVPMPLIDLPSNSSAKTSASVEAQPKTETKEGPIPKPILDKPLDKSEE